MKILSILFIFVDFILANIDINLDVSKKIISIGDKVQVTIIAMNTGTSKIEFPKIDIDNEDVSLFSISVGDTSLVLSLQFWQAGRHTFPSINIQIFSEDGNSNILSTDAINFDILDRIDNLDSTLRKSKVNKELYLPIAINQLILFIIILLSLVGMYKIFKRGQKQYVYEPISINIDFYKHAMNELDNLELPENMTGKELEAYYISLGNTLKRYLLSRFFFNATNMTTNEIIMYLKSHNIPIGGLANLLHEGDLCKFAQKKHGVVALIDAKKTAQDLLVNFEGTVI